MNCNPQQGLTSSCSLSLSCALCPHWSSFSSLNGPKPVHFSAWTTCPSSPFSAISFTLLAPPSFQFIHHFFRELPQPFVSRPGPPMKYSHRTMYFPLSYPCFKFTFSWIILSVVFLSFSGIQASWGQGLCPFLFTVVSFAPGVVHNTL